MKHVWFFVFVFLGVGIICLLAVQRSSNDDSDDVPGYDDLAPCKFLTSIDSTKSLYLSAHHQAKFSDKSGAAARWETGTWALVDDDRHIYRIDVDGSAIDFTLVTAPEGEGCMLAAGNLDSVDLRKSWFSSLTDPK